MIPYCVVVYLSNILYQYTVAPRPNINVHCSPLHVNVEQRTLIWVAEFVRDVLGTIDTTLATSVKDDFMSYLVMGHLCSNVLLNVVLLNYSIVEFL